MEGEGQGKLRTGFQDEIGEGTGNGSRREKGGRIIWGRERREREAVRVVDGAGKRGEEGGMERGREVSRTG